MKTKLTELLKIKYPIIQGGMAWVSEANLATSVSNAGGAGVIASAGRSPEWVREQIRLAKKLSKNPFGVNLVLMDHDVEQKKHVIAQEGVAFVMTGAGNPVPHIDFFHEYNIRIIPVVPNLKLAKRVADAGADAIVVEGLEAGGHIGKLTTMALMTQVLPEVEIPVIVAGGFVDGRGVAAALLMGASGVQMGTRFYASEECVAHQKCKDLIVASNDVDTETTGPRGHEVRGIKNAMTQRYHDLVREGVSQDQLEELVIGTSRKAPLEGDTEWGFVQAGQSLGQIKAVKSCQSIIDDIICGVEKCTNQLCQLISYSGQTQLHKRSSAPNQMGELPTDTVILVSLLNSKLRDSDDSLSDICAQYHADQIYVINQLAHRDYFYDDEKRQFKQR